MARQGCDQSLIVANKKNFGKTVHRFMLISPFRNWTEVMNRSLL